MAAPGVDQRGGGERSRTDAFRFAPGTTGRLAFASVGLLGLAAVAVAAFDLGGARARGDAALLVPGGLFLILIMLGLFWLAGRRPVLLAVGPEGLDLPAAFARPLAWAEIWRIRRIRRKVALQPAFVMLRVELMHGAAPAYRRRLWTWPKFDAWIARRFGLRVPLHNLDAPEAVILASVERFKPVQKVTA